MATLNFNAATVAPSDSFDVLPAGWYNVRITESSMKPTKDQQGSYLALTLTVIDGQYANRKLFERLNLNNKSQAAKDIAYKQLSAICHATGVIQLGDSTQLHGIPLMAKVSIKAADGKFEEGNEVKAYKAMTGAAVAAPAWVAPSATPAAAPAWAQPQAPQPPAAPPLITTAPQAPAAAPTPPWANQ